MNIPSSIPAKPKKLILELKCESTRHAQGMRMILKEVLSEYGYYKKDWKFEVEKEGR